MSHLIQAQPTTRPPHGKPLAVALCTAPLKLVASGTFQGARRSLTAIGAVFVAFLVLVPASVPAEAADQTQIEIVSKASGLRADVMWASSAEHAGVFLWPNNNNASQEFNLLDSGGGWFRIQARHSGQCLMLDWKAGNTNGAPIIQNPYCGTGYAASEWRVGFSECLPVGPFCFRRTTIVNRMSGRCLDARGAAVQQAVLQQWDCIRTGTEWNWRNQDWELQAINFTFPR
jgi:ricin-type beta-trefoil lectin protein